MCHGRRSASGPGVHVRHVSGVESSASGSATDSAGAAGAGGAAARGGGGCGNIRKRTACVREVSAGGVGTVKTPQQASKQASIVGTAGNTHDATELTLDTTRLPCPQLPLSLLLLLLAVYRRTSSTAVPRSSLEPSLLRVPVPSLLLPSPPLRSPPPLEHRLHVARDQHRECQCAWSLVSCTAALSCGTPCRMK